MILVPRRKDDGPRDAIWAMCRSRWEAQFPEWPIYEGHHDLGPFNRSMAINRAARAADADGEWDLAVVIDSDIFLTPDRIREAADQALETGLIVWPHRRWRGITQEATERLVLPDPGFAEEILGPGGFEHADLSEADMDLVVEKTNPISWSCCIMIPRAAWEKLGGFDERFEGWGFEDMAFQSAAVGLVGHLRLEGDVFHLWHPRSPGSGAPTRGPAGMLTREAVLNARLGRRYMVALRRDYGLHDRHTTSDAAELERDIDNLKRDDARLAHDAVRLGLPNWDLWWPSLEELRDGAARRDRSVTIIVHTDGRREFIAQSIPSLMERVTGNIIRRVIFDDSGDREYKEWLAAQFGEFGFYVVGPAQRLGYTGSMRAMWSYLQRKAPSQYVFLAEDDFVYDREVVLDSMIEALERHPYLRQMALLRGPYYPLEVQAGGIIQQKPEAYTRMDDPERVEHREYFTANPSVFSRALVSIPWPSANSSERAYTDVLNHDPDSRFAYWGDGTPWVTHIGSYRAGGHY